MFSVMHNDTFRPMKNPGNPAHGGGGPPGHAGGGGGPPPPVTGMNPALPDIIDLAGITDFTSLLDLAVSGGDIYVQFGDKYLDHDFDPGTALYYPIAAYGVEPLGPPPEATKVGLLPVQAGLTTLTTLKAGNYLTFPGYGGTLQQAVSTAVATTLTLPLNANITSLATPFHIIIRCLSSNAGTNRSFAALVEAGNTDNDPRAIIRVISSDNWSAAWTSAAATTSTGGITMTQDVWVTAIASFENSAGNVSVTCHVIQPGVGEILAPVTAPATIAFGTPTFTRLALGGLVNATGNQPLLIGDAWSHCIVYVGPLTQIQRQQFGEADCPPWDELCPDPTGIRCWAENVGGVIRDRTTGKTTSTVGIGTIANLTFSTYTGSPIRRHNRIKTQDANSVVNIPYGNVASPVVPLPFLSSCLWRSQAHHALKYDPATPATGQTLAAGVSRLYAQGGPIDTSVINNSGVATDIGVLNLSGTDYSPDLYRGLEFDLPYAVSNGARFLGGTQNGNVTGNTTRAWALFKPTVGSNWPVIPFAVGAGGQAGGDGTYVVGELDSEYSDMAAFLASHGYCCLIQAFADEAESNPWPSFAYVERIPEYRRLVRDELSSIIGYNAPMGLVGGHSGGTRTSLPCTGATYWSGGVPQHPGLVTLNGGGQVKGCIQFSGPPISASVPSTEVRAGTWATLEVPIIMFTGTLDSAGEGADHYSDRIEGWTYVAAGIPAVKVIGNFWHHLYGGLCSINTSVDKIRARNQRELSLSILLAFCDYCCGRNTAVAQRYLQNGPRDTQIDYTSPAGEVRYAAKDL